jgi:hypothetical protein
MAARMIAPPSSSSDCEGEEMPSYRVCFINEIPRNDKLFRCCQRSIVIRSARSRERAIEAAKRRFARLEAIRDWKIHAGLIEVEAIEIDEQKNPAHTETRKTSDRPKPALI